MCWFKEVFFMNIYVIHSLKYRKSHPRGSFKFFLFRKSTNACLPFHSQDIPVRGITGPNQMPGLGKVTWFGFQSDQRCYFLFPFSVLQTYAHWLPFLSFFTSSSYFAFAVLRCEVCVSICVESVRENQAVFCRTINVSGKLRCSWRSPLR